MITQADLAVDPQVLPPATLLCSVPWTVPESCLVARPCGPATLELVGEVDLLTSPMIRRELDRLDVGRGQDLVLDMTQVSFVDCSGIAVLFAAARRCQRNGGRLVLRGLAPQCFRAARLVGLDAVAEIEA